MFENRPFRDRIKELYDEWLVNQNMNIRLRETRNYFSPWHNVWVIAPTLSHAQFKKKEAWVGDEKQALR